MSLSPHRWYIYPTLGAVPATVTDEGLRKAGDRLANAVRALDSYAAASFPAPLERSQEADAALKAWEALTAALGSLQAAPVRANNGGGIEVMRVSDCEAVVRAKDAERARFAASWEQRRIAGQAQVARLVAENQRLRAALGEPSHETKET